MPQVSVIMPTYNRAWIIQRAVTSVLAQTFADFELLIADDGSTDDTLAALAHTGDDRVVVLPGPHRGQAATRNRALAAATGELIAYLDTDNCWHPTFLEVMTSELTAEYVLAYCSQHLFLVEGDRQHHHIAARKVRSVPYNPVAVLAGSSLDMSTILHRRSVVTEVGGFDEAMTAAVDWGFLAPVVARYPFAVKQVDQVLCDYYFYPPAVLETVTNRYVTATALRADFGIPDDDANAARVRARVQQILHKERGG